MHQAWQSWQRNRWPWIAAGVIAGSLILFAVAWLLIPTPSTPQAPDLPLSSETSQAEFFNMVIFGVNDLEGGSPRLGAVWVGTFEVVGKEGVLLGLPRTFQLSNNQSIEQAFAWTPELGLDPDFVAGVETTLGLGFDGAVVMDETCFQASINLIGGIPMEDGQRLDGLAALALYKLSANDPWTALEVQAKLLSSASLNLADLGEATDLSPLLDLTPDHCWLTMSDEFVVDLFLRMQPLSQDSIRVDTLAITN